MLLKLFFFIIEKFLKLNIRYFDNEILCSFYLIIYGEYFAWYLFFYFNDVIIWTFSIFLLGCYEFLVSHFLYLSLIFLFERSYFLFDKWQFMWWIKLNLHPQNLFFVKNVFLKFSVFKMTCSTMLLLLKLNKISLRITLVV